MQTAEAKRVAIYVRVSTPGQEDGASLESQEVSCRALATERGWQVAAVYREVYSGAELWDRPRLTELRAAMRAGVVDVVLVHAIDRLARNPVHLGVLITEAEHHGVLVEFVTEPGDNSPEGQLIRYVRGYAAQVEREKIRERSIRNKRARAEAGKLFNYGRNLYGYRRDKAAGVREVYEPEAAIVRDIFTLCAADGLPIRSIARSLTARGIPAPHKGARWGKSTVQRILAEPAYKGEAYAWRWKHHDKREGGSILRPASEWLRLPDSTTPALVSPELWDGAQARLASNQGEATRNQRRPYLLRGMVVCAVCSRRMHSAPEKGQRRTYRCSSRDTSAGACGGKRVRADDLERWLWDEISRRLQQPELIEAEAAKRRDRGPEPGLAASLESTRRRLAVVEKQQERLVSRYAAAVDDSFPWELVEREMARIRGEQTQLEAALKDLEHRIAQQQAATVRLEALSAYCKRVADRLAGFGFDDQREALEALSIRVLANGKAWRVLGAVPDGKDVVLATSYS